MEPKKTKQDYTGKWMGLKSWEEIETVVTDRTALEVPNALFNHSRKKRLATMIMAMMMTMTMAVEAAGTTTTTVMMMMMMMMMMITLYLFPLGLYNYYNDNNPR